MAANEFLTLEYGEGDERCTKYVYIHTIEDITIRKTDKRDGLPWEAQIDSTQHIWHGYCKTYEDCKKRMETILLGARSTRLVRLQEERDFAVKLVTDTIEKRCGELLEEPSAKRQRRE